MAPCHEHARDNIKKYMAVNTLDYPPSARSYLRPAPGGPQTAKGAQHPTKGYLHTARDVRTHRKAVHAPLMDVCAQPTAVRIQPLEVCTQPRPFCAGNGLFWQKQAQFFCFTEVGSARRVPRRGKDAVRLYCERWRSWARACERTVRRRVRLVTLGGLTSAADLCEKL